MNLRRESRRLARVVGFSLQLLAANRRRTALTASALLIGVATVGIFVAFGEGANRRIAERVRALGTDVVIVTAPPAARVAGRERQSGTATALRPGDADAIANESAAAMRAAPMIARTATVRIGERNANVLVIGTTPDGLGIRRMRTRTGRPFDQHEEHEQRRVALIGPTVSRLLFQLDDPVGREIRIGAVPFEIVGQLAPRGTDLGGTDLDSEVVIPLSTAMRRVFNIPYVTGIVVQATSAEALHRLDADVRDILARRHPRRAALGAIGAMPESGEGNAFVVQNQAVLLRTSRGATRVLHRMTLAVSLLALSVGGVGIAAVMHLAVSERVREIGLRRAVGARRRDVHLQFLVEAVLLAAIGGGAGVALALLFALIGSAVLGWPLVLPWSAVMAGLLISMMLGLVGGAMPARRAVSLEPSAALR